jgi:hypothetical protein
MSLAGSCFSTESAHGPLYGAFLAASCPNGSFEHLPSKSGQLFEQRGAGHQVNILHRFCTSERSVFMPRSAANCLWNFCDYRQMYLIVWLFLVGGRGIEPLTPSMSRKCSSAELTARCDGSLRRNQPDLASPDREGQAIEFKTHGLTLRCERK